MSLRQTICHRYEEVGRIPCLSSSIFIVLFLYASLSWSTIQRNLCDSLDRAVYKGGELEIERAGHGMPKEVQLELCLRCGEFRMHVPGIVLRIAINRD